MRMNRAPNSSILLLAASMVLIRPAPAAKAEPFIGRGGVVNVASFAPSGAPNSAIAQGSMFTIFGEGVGPATLRVVNQFPLPTELAGTSVQVIVDGTLVSCIMIFTSAHQLAVILPSSTPLGKGGVTVTYNGLASAPEPLEIVQSSFGTFAVNQTGRGAGVVQNFVSQEAQPLNGLIQAAQPGQVEILWGTGLGPVEGEEAAGPLPGDLNVDAEVLVGGTRATVLYAGRSGCCAGIDQIVFVVPAGIEGCYVPVAIKVGGVVSNYTTISIATDGTVCSDPHGFTRAEVQDLHSGEALRAGSVILRRVFGRDDAQGAFLAYPAESFFTARPALQQVLGFEQTVNLGACMVSTFRSEVFDPAGPMDSIKPQPLDAGAFLLLRGPRGERELPNDAPGSYFTVLSTGPPEMLEPFLEAGTYNVTGPGGVDVGPLTAGLQLSPIPTWTNREQIEQIPRNEDLTITWTGGGPTQFVRIVGASFNAATDVEGVFFCAIRAAEGAIIIPPEVLGSLPPSGPGGFLDFWSSSIPTRFTAPGLDIGIFSYTAKIDTKGVVFQ